MSKGTERTLWTSCFIQVELTCYLPFVTFNKNSGFIAFLSGNILYVGLFVLLIWLYCCYIVDMLTDYYYTDEFYNKVNYAPRYQSARWDTFAFDDFFSNIDALQQAAAEDSKSETAAHDRKWSWFSFQNKAYMFQRLS